MKLQHVYSLMNVSVVYCVCRNSFMQNKFAYVVNKSLCELDSKQMVVQVRCNVDTEQILICLLTA